MLKIIELGFGRTGTMSLKHALEQLGFGKCYHFIELYEHPDHTKVWQAARRGEAVDWEKFFDGYQATVYWSPCYDYLELLQAHPDLKVILSVRDPEKWYRSTYDTIYKFNRLTFLRKLFLQTMGLFNPKFKGIYAVWQLQEQTLWQTVFKGRFHDKDYAIEVFNNHIEEVKSKVPAERLLIFDIKDGWEPLCDFLQLPIPDTPFPRINDAASFVEKRSRLFKLWPFKAKNK